MFVVAWVFDPALVLVLMLMVPVWAMISLVLGMAERHRMAGRVTALVAVATLGSCVPAARWHLQWYKARADRELRTFMASEVEGRPKSRFTARHVLAGVEPERRRQLMAEYAAGRCALVMMDELFGAPTIVARCPDGTQLLATMREWPAFQWSIDVSVMAIGRR